VPTGILDTTSTNSWNVIAGIYHLF
jgi:hypothetical protein